MRKTHSPIQKKLLRVIMMITGIVLIMTSAAYFVYEIVTAREITRRQLTTLAEMIALNSTAALAFESREDATELLSFLKAEQNVVAACLFDSTGNVFAKYPENLSETGLPTPPFRRGFFFRNNYLSGFAPVILDGKLMGTVFLKSDMRAIYERFALYGIIATLFIVISFVFAYAISKRMQKAISNPILDLADKARFISEKNDYSVRVTRYSNDEVGELTDAFNHMLTRIEIQNDEITKLNQNLEHKVLERTKELEEAIEALRKQTEFAEKIFDSTVDLIAVFDTRLRYLTMNSQSEMMYKKTREEVKGHYLAELFPQTIESGMIADLQEALKGGIVRRPNYRSIVTSRVYESFYVPLKDEAGRVYCVLAIAHDVTDMIEANEKLQRLNQELGKSNSELEQFAYVASHDLQEPLRKIQTFSELGEKNINNHEALKRYLHKVNSSAQRMTELIKAILNYSRLSRTDNEFSIVDLNKVLQSILNDLELLIEEKHAKVTSDHLPIVEGIPLQLHQLFLNLITNSLKFNDRQPVLRISARMGRWDEFEHANALEKYEEYVQLTFSDNGVGFEEKFTDKIFSIFQRLHNDRTFAGTGIGLALCKKVVENHDGHIAVRSQPGEGTTFYIYLPMVKVKAAQFTKTSSTKK